MFLSPPSAEEIDDRSVRGGWREEKSSFLNYRLLISLFPGEGLSLGRGFRVVLQKSLIVALALGLFFGDSFGSRDIFLATYFTLFLTEGDMLRVFSFFS